MTRTSIRECARFAMFALLCVVMTAHASAAPLRAWFDRPSMQLGETVTLNIEADATDSAQPDFSALNKDFDLHGTQSSRQVSIVNGATSSTTLWAVALEPKHAGTIGVAPITVGNAQTNPLTLDVLAAAPATAPKANGDVFLEATAEPLTPYVQQEVRYSTKLYFAVDLGGGSLADPKAEGLGVKQLGQDKTYDATVGTRRYKVIERHYALTPERSGAIDIPAITFRGTALNAGDPMGFFRGGRNVSARSEPVHLDVKAKPVQWTAGPWLPAASLLLKDETPLPDEVHVGDPITRTIRLQAKGLAHEQLPDFGIAKPNGAELYPDKADSRTRDDGEWLYGERVQKFAFVPDRAGTLIIPGVEVHWWDTQNNRAEVAQLPEKTITVLAAAGAAAVPAAGGVAAPESVSAPSTIAPAPISKATSRHRLRIWKALAIVGFVLWLSTLALWWRSRRRMRAMSVASARVVDSSSQRAAFLRACSLGEFAAAERALVAWARGERADVRNLGELSSRLGDRAQTAALADLQRTRYAGEPVQGLAQRLEKAFKGGLVWQGHAPARDGEASALPSLYPSRD
ncbi:MAG: BatD family protein [Dokdonella sp.]